MLDVVHIVNIHISGVGSTPICRKSVATFYWFSFEDECSGWDLTHKPFTQNAPLAEWLSVREALVSVGSCRWVVGKNRNLIAAPRIIQVLWREFPLNALLATCIMAPEDSVAFAQQFHHSFTVSTPRTARQIEK
jgi:hypothetical protein